MHLRCDASVSPRQKFPSIKYSAPSTGRSECVGNATETGLSSCNSFELVGGARYNRRDHRIGESRRVPRRGGRHRRRCPSHGSSRLLATSTSAARHFVARIHDRYLFGPEIFPLSSFIVPQYSPYCPFRTSLEQTGKRMVDQAAGVRGREAWNLGGI